MVELTVFGAVVGQGDAADADGPRQGRHFGLRGRCRTGRFFGPGGGGQVGVAAAVEQDALREDLLAFEFYPAGVDRAVGQSDREFGDGGRGPHPESQVGYREPSDTDRPGQGGGAVLFLFGGGFGQVEPDVPIGEGDPGDVGFAGRKVGFGSFEGELSGGDAQVHTRQRIFVVGGDAFQREIPDDDLFADQRPQGCVQREFAAAEERVGLIDQQCIVDRQPQREDEADAFDRQIHPEGPRGIVGGFAPDEVLNDRDVEQRGNQQHQQQDDEQRPERIFENLFQHLQKLRVP